MSDFKPYGPLNENCAFRPCSLSKSHPVDFTYFGSVCQKKSVDLPSLYAVYVTTCSPSVQTSLSGFVQVLCRTSDTGCLHRVNNRISRQYSLNFQYQYCEAPPLYTILSHVILLRITTACFFRKRTILIIFVLSPIGVTWEHYSQSCSPQKISSNFLSAPSDLQVWTITISFFLIQQTCWRRDVAFGYDMF